MILQMFQEDVSGAETIRSKLATVCWIYFVVVFNKIDLVSSRVILEILLMYVINL